jgi:type II secretory pathway predicted ATPase ExeA
MLTEVMRHYHLTRPPVEVGFFETEHHAQVARDVRVAIQGGRLIALTAVIGAGKTVLARRLRDEIEREGRIIVSRALTVEKAKITVPLLIAALFYDLSTEKTVSISSQSERRERDLQELFRKAKKPVALFIDDAHDLASEDADRLEAPGRAGGRGRRPALRGSHRPSEAQERPSSSEDGGDRRSNDRLRVRRYP